MTETPEPEKCHVVKTGRVDLMCSLPLGHDKPQDGQPGTWHESVFTDHHEISYEGARHVTDMTERVTWEPVDHIAEATRHLLAGRNRSTS